MEATVILIFASLCNGDKLLNFIPIVLEQILSYQRRPLLEDFFVFRSKRGCSVFQKKAEKHGGVLIHTKDFLIFRAPEREFMLVLQKNMAASSPAERTKRHFCKRYREI